MGRGRLASGEFSIDVRFYRLSPELQPYFTALYSFEFHCAEGEQIADFLHPEWSAMRFFYDGPPPFASVYPDARERRSPFAVSGPTSRAIDFSVESCNVFGLGLQPAGFARFCPANAIDLADTIVDGDKHEAFAAFRPIMDFVQSAGANSQEAATRINRFLIEQLKPLKVRNAQRIDACHEALKDPAIADVESLSERVGVNSRTLERMCRRYFGFPPKVLLRRQRFLRSLSAFMLDPQQNWSMALDSQYVDQAHFVRDFRSFMGIAPSEYAKTPHPILDRIMAQRMADQGVAPETDLPTILRYTDRDA